MFSIEMLPAGHGDALLVAYGDQRAAASPRYVLIDGGPYYAFRNDRLLANKALSKRMERLAAQGAGLELLVNTHVDADHIEGVVKLLGNAPPGLQVGDVWFNAWRHLRPDVVDMLGPVHGEMLSALIGQKRLSWNGAFGGQRVAATEEGALPTTTLPGGLRITLLSPRPADLAAMADTWEGELRQAGLDPDAPHAALLRLRESDRLRPEDLRGAAKPDVEALGEAPFQADESPANGSSIAFVAEFEGKRCLFAGDARPDVLEESLRRLARQWGERRLRLDALKVAHHGSGHNLTRALLEMVSCPRYLISTNGRYFGHPDPAAVARIILYSSKAPRLCFNYRTPQNAVWDDPALKADYGYDTVYPQGRPGLVVAL